MQVRKPAFDLAKDLSRLPQITRGYVSCVERHNAVYFAPGFDPDHKNNYPLAEAALRALGFAIAL